MIRIEGARAEVSGPMTMAGAAVLLAEGEAAVRSDALIFDMSGVGELDSSSLAVVFCWMRAARAAGKTVRLFNPPQNLLSLAEVYGVTDLLPSH